MPVVTSHPYRALPLHPTATLFFALSFILLIGLLLRRTTQRNNPVMSASSYYEFQAPEKEPLMPVQDQEADLNSQYPDKSALSVTPGPIPQTHQQQPEPHSFPPPPPFPEPTISLYQEPEELEGEPMIFTSFEQAIAVDLPRRRSYTKTTAGEAQVSGEIVVDPSAGWRRHTKVFGGGVCIACEENERRMSA